MPPSVGLTFRQCLAHHTHLPAVEPLYTYGQDPQTLRAFVLQRVWRPGPPVYSDINFILLGIAIERLSGSALIDAKLPAGLTFRPDATRCAATERCTWRGRVIRGEVHDENAFALGGASGHAGLFGTIDGRARLRARASRRLAALARLHRRHSSSRTSATRSVGWECRHAGMARRRCVFERDHRPYGIYRHRPVDRFRARDRVVAAHQSRPSDPPSRDRDSRAPARDREQVVTAFSTAQPDARRICPRPAHTIAPGVRLDLYWSARKIAS